MNTTVQSNLLMTTFQSRCNKGVSFLRHISNQRETYTSTLNLRHENKHELILVYKRANPEYDGGSERDERGQWRKDDSHRTHEKLNHRRLGHSNFKSETETEPTMFEL